MKSFAVIATLAFAVASNAKAILYGVESSYTVGKTYTIQWHQDGTDNIELLLVKKGHGDIAWTSVDKLIKKQVSNPPEGNYTWTVEDNFTPGKNFGFWIDATPVNGGNDGYADLSHWFTIEPASSS